MQEVPVKFKDKVVGKASEVDGKVVMVIDDDIAAREIVRHITDEELDTVCRPPEVVKFPDGTYRPGVINTARKETRLLVAPHGTFRISDRTPPPTINAKAARFSACKECGKPTREASGYCFKCQQHIENFFQAVNQCPPVNEIDFPFKDE